MEPLENKIIDIEEFGYGMMQAIIIKPDGSKCYTTFPKYPIVEYDKNGKIVKYSNRK
jgi:hypothetical protein